MKITNADYEEIRKSGVDFCDSLNTAEQKLKFNAFLATLMMIFAENIEENNNEDN